MISTSERLLALPLFADLDPAELAGVLRARELAAGDELWRQGDSADALYVVESGSLEVAGRLPGRRELTLAVVGVGEVLGELALLDDGRRTASVRALEPTRLVGIGRTEFRALVLGRNRCARVIRRRLAEVACGRLRDRHAALASTLSGEAAFRPAARGVPSPPPALHYLIRLPFFRDHDAAELEALLRDATVEQVERGTVLVAEGEASPGLCVTLNGAVEETIRRAGGAIRVALAGPGRAFGYAALLAGRAASATAAARERSVVLVVDASGLERRLEEDAFASAVERDVVHALRQAERPQARLAAARRRVQHG